MKYHKPFLILLIFIFIISCGKDDDSTSVNRPPNNFQLLQIENNAINVSLNPQLTWENAIDPEGDEVTYQILLDMNSAAPTTIIASGLELTNYTIDNSLEFKTEYSWQVIANDTNGNSTASEIFSFTSREIQAINATENAGFTERENHTLVSFDNRMWIIDGAELGDVWSSNDGVIWTEETSNSNFPNRFDHSSVVFDGKIWIIGGTGNNVVYNDIWSSADGINWIQENSNASFPERYAHTSVVFDNRIWVIGGENGTLEFNDVWSSSDGLNWVQENNNPPFLSRFNHSSVVFDNRIWVIGGLNSVQGSGVGNLNDVWSSADGVNWNQESANAEFSARYGHATAVFDNKIWVLGGSGGNGLSDIWSSADGINWKEKSSNAAFSGRMNHRSITFNDNIWITSGWSTGSLLNDVWYLE